MNVLGSFESEAEAWGISLGDRYELETLCRPSLKPLEKFTHEDHADFEFRSRVAEALIFGGLPGKAARYLECARKGIVLCCEGHDHHEFFSPMYCDLRFCPRCAPRRFARLYAKHSPVLEHIRRHPIRGFRLRGITLTSRNTGELSTEQIKKFNKDVKKTLRLLMKGVKGWGAIWVNEVGFNNTNLHTHVLMYSPYVEKEKLKAIWQKVSGHVVAGIRQSQLTGPKALLYMLKYVSKPPSDDPEMVGRLEVAFHGTRRAHALGLFYDFAGGDEDNLQSEWKNCPLCGAALVREKGFHPVHELRARAIRSISDVRTERRRNKWVN
jgi:hypothetical protein